MFGQILFPLDGSPLAERALPVAERIARAGGARLHLVRVFDPLANITWVPVLGYLPTETWERGEREASAYLTAQRDRLAAGGVAVKSTTLDGNVGAALLDYERATHVDLVVMCSHGRSGLARFALGSVSERLLRYGTAPLLLARAFGEPVCLEQVVVPLDGSARAEEALALTERLAGAVVSAVTLLRIIDSSQEGPEAETYLETIARRLPRGLIVHRRVAQGDPAEHIAALGAEHLVLMATHGRIGVARWALGSVADRVAHAGVAGLLLLRTHS